MTASIYLLSTGKYAIRPIAEDIGPGPHSVAFIYTGAEDSYLDDAWYLDDKKAVYEESGWNLFDYTITGKTLEDLKRDLGEADLLYVVGGDTTYLLAQIQHSNFTAFVREHLAAGKAYIGQSAGAISAGPDIGPLMRSDHAENAKLITSSEGMGIVDFVVVPHWGEKSRGWLMREERLDRIHNEDHIYVPLTDYQYAKVAADGSYQIVDVRRKPA